MLANGRIGPNGVVSSSRPSNGFAAFGVFGPKVVSTTPMRFNDRADTPSGPVAPPPFGPSGPFSALAADNNPVTIRSGCWL